MFLRLLLAAMKRCFKPAQTTSAVAQTRQTMDKYIAVGVVGNKGAAVGVVGNKGAAVGVVGNKGAAVGVVGNKGAAVGVVGNKGATPVARRTLLLVRLF